MIEGARRAQPGRSEPSPEAIARIDEIINQAMSGGMVIDADGTLSIDSELGESITTLDGSWWPTKLGSGWGMELELDAYEGDRFEGRIEDGVLVIRPADESVGLPPMYFVRAE